MDVRRPVTGRLRQPQSLELLDRRRRAAREGQRGDREHPQQTATESPTSDLAAWTGRQWRGRVVHSGLIAPATHVAPLVRSVSGIASPLPGVAYLRAETRYEREGPPILCAHPNVGRPIDHGWSGVLFSRLARRHPRADRRVDLAACRSRFRRSSWTLLRASRCCRMHSRRGSTPSEPGGAIRCGCTDPDGWPPRRSTGPATSWPAAVGARPDEVVFTGSGTQSSQAAVAGLAIGRRRIGSRIVTTAIDHSSVLAAAAAAGEHVAGRC